MAIFELRGQVIDSLTHAGISGCEIELWLVGNDAPYYSEMHCLTISNGSFSLTGTFDKLNIDVTQFFLKVKIDQDVVKQSSLYNIVDVKDKVLLINIEVDTVSKSGNMRVQGRLVLSDGAPLSGKYIVVYDKSLSDLTQLGFATTDEDGYYVVGYDFPLEGSNKVSPDLILKVFSDSTETELIASSPLFLSAKASLEVNLTTDEIFKDRSRFDSCFRRLVNDEEVFDKILDGQVNQSIRLENIKVLNAADISYLSNRLQVDSKEISLVFKALELLLDCDFYSLDNVEMLYGIFSMIKIATAPGVFYSSKEQLLGMMATAGEQNVTKTFSQQDCEDFIDDLKEKIITLVVSDSENEQLTAFFTCCGLGSSTQDVETKKEILNCLLQDIESSTDENEDVVSFLTTKIGNSGISSTLVKKVELFINAYHFSQNLQFTTELFNGFVSNIDQLTSKNKSDLVSFLTTHAIGLPNGYSSLEEFATFIRSKIIAKYPEKVLNLLFDTDGYFTNTKVKTFLGLNADYPLLSNTVSDILSNESIVLTGFDEQQIIDLKKEMGRAQRLCYLVPLNDWENSLKVLWEMGFEGSIDLTLNKTEDDFVSAFSIAYAELLQVATDVSINAKYIYRLSRLQNDVNLGIWSKYSQQLNSLSSRVLPTGAITNSENDSPALPTFEDLFGGSDFCRCSSGRSVTSPAAYLADLLNFEVQQTTTSTGTINVYELLGSRRPDITKLLLNEKNTFTELPYIDLVIELLGDVIQSDIPYDLPGHNTTLDTLTLLAIPEHLESLDSAILKVYGNDQNPVVYPWSLPYNYWLEECRAWLEHLTVSRYKLMEYFPYLSQESSNQNDNGTDYIIEEPGDKEYFIHTQGSLAGEYLGLNKNEVTQVFNSELSVTALYNIDDISTLITVGDFLRKSGLTYTEIKELLQSYYVNPKTTLENTEYRIYIVLATKEIVKDSGHFMEDCDLNKASFMLCSTVDNIDIPGEIFIGFLKRIYQYTILKRKLRIGVPLLDFILKSTNYIHDPINLLLDESLLPKIHDILLLSRDYSIDVEDVILFYDEFDRDLVYEGYTGKFDMLFRNKSFGSQEDVFDTSPLPRLDDSRVRTILCSALSISEADYNTLLIYEGLYDPESPNDTKLASTLNISLIYRTITFCKFLGIEQKDYYRLIAINNNKTPVQRLYVGSYQPEPSDTRFFIDVFRQLQNMAITPLELNLMFGNRMLSSLSDIFSITDKSDFCTDLANKLKSRKQELDVQLGLNIEHQRGTVIDNLYRHLWESDQEISNIDETVELVLRVIEMDPTVNINSTEVSQAFSFAFPNGSATLQYYMNYTGDDQYALYEYAINCWTDQVAPKKLNALREIFASLMSVSELEIAVELVHDGNDDPDSVPYNQIIQQYFSLFMDANEAVEILLENSDTYNNRVEFVLNHWETHILESIIINEISERCIVSQNIATGLAKKWIKVTIEENEYLLIERFLDPEFLELFTSDLWQTNAISSSAYLHLLDLINKSVYFIKKYSINEFACDFISNYHYVEVQTPYFKILNIFNLPVFSGDPLNEYTSYAEESSTINNSDKHSEPTVRSSTRPPNSGEPSWLELWYVLDNSYSYNNAFAKGTYSLFEVWDMCFIPNLEVNSILEKLAIITGWNYTDVHYLKGVTENPLSLESLQNVAWVKRLSDQLYLSAISGVSPYSIIRVNYPEPGKNQALKLRSVVKNKYSRKQWLEIAKSIMDPLRIQLRDVFLDYLVNRGFDLPDNVHIDFDSVNSLYDYFLIDSLMNPCAMTSRVVQATMSIQVLIQRILLCLETDISLEANQQGQWSWYKNYRVWEACRKAFLYPENWLEPEWRKGKSEIFSQLEDYLKQNDVTSESSEKAYLNYVGKLNELSDLEVISIFREGTSDEIDKIHYLGRTRSLPHIHYYRMCKNASFENAEWTPWEKVEIDIESESATLAVVNDVVFIIWPFLISKAIEHPTKETSPGYEVRVAFTQKKNNVWNRKYVSETGLTGFNDGNFLYYNVMDITSDGEIQLALISDCQEYELAKGFPLIKLNGEVVYRNLDIQKSGYLHTPGSFRGGKLLVSSTAGKVTIHNSYNSGSPIEITSSSSAGENDFLAVGNMIAYSTTDPSTFLNGYTLLLPLVYKNNKADWYGIPIIVYGKKFIYQNQFRNLLSKSLDLINTTDTSVEFWNEDSSFHYSTQEHKIIISSSKSNDEIKVNEPLENVNRNQVVLKYKMYAFNHLFAAQLIDKIFKEGVLSISNQDQNNIFFRQKASSELNHGISLGFDSWAAKNNVEIDFYKSYPYSLYNWELFFHIPMLIASRLSANLQFEDAQKWYHLIFDPTNKLDQSNDFEVAHPWLRVWKFKPFYTILKEVNIREILYHTSLSGYYSNQIDDWKDDPLNTFSLAEERIYPYMRNVVMKYLDNLFAWGDYLFSQDTMESLNEATQLYILAAEILGPRPVIVDTTLPEEVSFVGLGDELDAFSNKLFPIESFAAGCRNGELFDKELATPSTNPLSKSTVESLYFEIPYNGKLITYWDTVEDRLFKLRNCMNLKGSIRELPLFQPPIDPALLIQASQAGLDFSQIVAGLNLPASCYRYRVLSQKAKELANEVVSLGSSLLSAMEKKDAETIALLRNSQEKALLKVITSVKEQAINESQASIDSLELSIANAQDRLTYYSGRPYMNDREKANLHNTALASDYQSESQDLHSLASILGAFPQIHVGVAAASEQGGIQLSVIPMMAAMIKDSLSSYYQYRAQVSAITGGYDRRQDDWKFQASQATGEVNSLQKQLIGAKVRLAIAQKELSNHELQIQHADDNYTFLKEKFTNEQLYEWMVSELSSVYFQSYKLAVDYAHQAEKAFRFETSTSSTTDIIDYNHWDNLREGLMAGERLRLELNLLDKEYLDKNIRNLEITKNISLALINPSALGELRVRGYCEISIPEYLFDLDYPGQYSRRIKSVAISIPAVSAPNANISCKLTLRSSCYRFDTRCPDPGQNGRTAYDQIDSDTRFVYNPITSQSIATSSAMNDRGVFDFNFNDERYLPFEGAGVISSWKLELPEQFRQFDYDSITDVVLHISYSALDAGEILKSKALESLTYAMEHGLASGTLMALPLEWKAEFVDELFQVQNENAHSSQFVLGLKHFPTFVQDYLTKNSSIHLKIKSVDFIVKGENLTTLCLKKFSPSDPVTKNFTPYINSGYSYTRIIKTDGNNNDLPLDWQLNNSGTPFELTISESTGVSIENIWMIVNYTCS